MKMFVEHRHDIKDKNSPCSMFLVLDGRQGRPDIDRLLPLGDPHFEKDKNNVCMSHFPNIVQRMEKMCY